MTIDLHKLHDVFLGNSYGKGCGKTVAVCTQIAGLLELGRPDAITIILSSESRIEQFKTILQTVLVEM